MGQKFYANPSTRRVESNGAVSFAPGGPFDCVGHWAKIQNCPIDGAPGLRLTCYATGYADSYFSVPACTRYRGRYIGGFFTSGEDGPVFVPFDRFHAHLGIPCIEVHHSPDWADWHVTVDGVRDDGIPVTHGILQAIDAAAAAYPGRKIIDPTMPNHSSRKGV